MGYGHIRIYFKIEADISEAQKEEFIRMAQKYSPVFNSIAKPCSPDSWHGGDKRRQEVCQGPGHRPALRLTQAQKQLP